ncbi:hypothetical protein Q3G72_033399 [Acer saccharum]|nr:hypothetical protein Q3G72_033399 [Acer saccharum]
MDTACLEGKSAPSPWQAASWARDAQATSPGLASPRLMLPSLFQGKVIKQHTAHSIAKLASTIDEDKFWLGDLPPQVASYVLANIPA